ncbi:hypothetical protein PYCC9005_004352 [Savitreella phatthalungensis]
MFVFFLLVVRAIAQSVQSDQFPVVDLGYARIRGYTEIATSTDAFKGIRYAAPPERWGRPMRPPTQRALVLNATAYGPRCLQSAASSGAAIDPLASGYSEDCLFLNVFRPAGVTSNDSLPVLVFIHGGGYGQLTGNLNDTYLASLAGNTQRFVFVSIAYRLGAFGFLASDELKQGGGALNAGLLDQESALEWVSRHIGAFGGDADRVTIWGESAGAGSVMQQLLSYGGSRNGKLFNQAILSSPYLPPQPQYYDAVPTEYYYRFVRAAGCANSTDKVACLRAAPSNILAVASNDVSQTAPYGSWAFTPVVDGTFVTGRPSELLLRQVSKQIPIMVGMNGDEGSLFVPSNITGTAAFDLWLSTLLPRFNGAASVKLREYYPDPGSSGGLYTSQQTRANTIFGDLIFNCAGIWLADAHESAWKYEFDVLPALHGFDVPHYLPDGTSVPYTPGADARPFDLAFATISTSFVTAGRPVSNGGLALPSWSANITPNVQQTAFNRTNAGQPIVSVTSGRLRTNGMDRCDFWRAHADLVPV